MITVVTVVIVVWLLCGVAILFSLYMLKRNREVYDFRRHIIDGMCSHMGDEFWELDRVFKSVSYQEMMQVRNAFKPVESFYPPEFLDKTISKRKNN